MGGWREEIGLFGSQVIVHHLGKDAKAETQEPGSRNHKEVLLTSLFPYSSSPPAQEWHQTQWARPS